MAGSQDTLANPVFSTLPVATSRSTTPLPSGGITALVSPRPFAARDRRCVRRTTDRAPAWTRSSSRARRRVPVSTSRRRHRNAAFSPLTRSAALPGDGSYNLRATASDAGRQRRPQRSSPASSVDNTPDRAGHADAGWRPCLGAPVITFTAGRSTRRSTAPTRASITTTCSTEPGDLAPTQVLSPPTSVHGRQRYRATAPTPYTYTSPPSTRPAIVSASASGPRVSSSIHGDLRTDGDHRARDADQSAAADHVGRARRAALHIDHYKVYRTASRASGTVPAPRRRSPTTRRR